jgi:hypothetical protein
MKAMPAQMKNAAAGLQTCGNAHAHATLMPHVMRASMPRYYAATAD